MGVQGIAVESRGPIKFIVFAATSSERSRCPMQNRYRLEISLETIRAKATMPHLFRATILA